MTQAWTVCRIAVPGLIHSAALDELVEATVYGLTELGYSVILTDGISSTPCILVGGHLLPSQACAHLHPDVIIYNSEHVNSVFFKPESGYYLPHYLDMLHRTQVWDYSFDNARALGAMLGKNVRYVPLGYIPQFTRVTPQIEDIDVLFYGWMKPRRQAILNDLTRRGLNVQCGTAVYGRERDHLIGRAKVVLNIHLYLPGSLEIARLGYLLANGKAVVSENNQGETVDDDLVGGFLAVPYEGLADAAHSLVHNHARRRSLARIGFDKFRARNPAMILRSALASSWDER